MVGRRGAGWLPNRGWGAGWLSLTIAMVVRRILLSAASTAGLETGHVRCQAGQ